MAILKMKKIRLCGIAEEQDQLIRELQLLGSVEIGSPEALTEAQQTQLFRTADGAGADALSQTSAALASALETLKHYETKKGGMFSARPEKTLGELFDDDAYRAAVQTAQEALDTQDARSRNQAEKSRLTALRESFVPWRTLDLPLETGGTQHARVLLGTVPAQTELDALRETVYGAAGEAQVERISADLQSQYLLVIVHKGAYDAAASALREYGFTPAGFDGAVGHGGGEHPPDGRKARGLRAGGQASDGQAHSACGRRARHPAGSRSLHAGDLEGAGRRPAGTLRTDLLSGRLGAV